MAIGGNGLLPILGSAKGILEIAWFGLHCPMVERNACLVVVAALILSLRVLCVCRTKDGAVSGRNLHGI